MNPDGEAVTAVPSPRHPSLYQLNTRARLAELADELGRPATLDDIPDASLDRFAAEDFVDSFRALQPDLAGAYTYWEPWRERRARNIGWRIDYVWVSRDLVPSLRRAFIVSDVMGSDHCPVGIELDI